MPEKVTDTILVDISKKWGIILSRIPIREANV
jgi:hypothetical protein